MHIRAIHAAHTGRTLIACASALVLIQFAGCAANRPDPAAEAAASTALGLGQAIEFRTDGGPIDEAAEAGDTLPLGDAVRRAATTDPGLQAALARVRIAMADADQARLLPNPVLNFVLRWGPGSPQIDAGTPVPNRSASCTLVMVLTAGVPRMMRGELQPLPVRLAQSVTSLSET